MNIFIIILLFFSLLGFLDYVFDLKLDIKDDFIDGMKTIGTLSLSMLGILTVGVAFVMNHIDAILNSMSHLPFDPVVLVGAILCPDMGGLPIATSITNTTLALFGGVFLCSIMGQTVTFQIPIFVGVIEQKDHPLLFKSFILGIMVIPVGLLLSGLFLQLSFKTLMINWIPILVICLIITVGMLVFSDITVKIFTVLGKIIQYITYLLFLIAVVGFLFPKYAYVPVESLQEAMLTILRIGLIISGSLVLSKLVLKYFKKPIHKLANYLGINDIAMVGLVLSMATSLAMLPLYSKMDTKGKMINGAFSVSGAYLLGGQLAYIASNVSSSIVTYYIIVKTVCGILSIALVLLIGNRFIPKRD